jgi:RNA polymerase sigma-70 factor (ECF subfamily)
VEAQAVTAAPAEQRAVVDRYAAAFERADVPAIVRLLAAEVVLEMPPMWNWYAGPVDYAGFMTRVYRTRGRDWRTVPVWANGEAGFTAYLDGALHSVQVFTVSRGLVLRASVFADPIVFEVFGSEPRYPAPPGADRSDRHR